MAHFLKVLEGSEDFWFLDTWLRLSDPYICLRYYFSCWCSVAVTALGFEITQNLSSLGFVCVGTCMSDLTAKTFKEPSHIVVTMTVIDFPFFLLFKIFWGFLRFLTPHGKPHTFDPESI